MDLIRLKNVNKKYKNGVTAIYDLSLSIKKGSFVFVIGKVKENVYSVCIVLIFDGSANVLLKRKFRLSCEKMSALTSLINIFTRVFC